MAANLLKSKRTLCDRVLVATVVSGLVCCGCQAEKTNPPPGIAAAQSLPFEIEQAGNPGYVGWTACAECHADRVHEFQATRHFQACVLPDQAELPPGFDPGQEAFLTPESPVRFEMRGAPEPALTAISSTPLGNEKTVSPIAFIYGAGAGTDEVYFTRQGDKLFELPVVWLHPQQKWGASMFDPHGSGDYSRPLSPQCLECHNVWVDYLRGSLNQYGPLEPQLLGVTCERCHGPAKQHVAWHRAHPGETVPAEIVRPKTLSRERQMDLCAQCHTNTVRHRQPPFSYRPGEPLEDAFLVLEMKYPERNRVANQVRYLKESRCFQASETMTCTTCHDPHRKKDAADAASSNQSCLTCHQPEQCGARSRLPSAVQDDCVSCHMPRRNKVQVNFETADGDIAFPAPRYEHRIAVYPEAEWERLWRHYGEQTDAESMSERIQLASRLADHWSKLAESAQDSQRWLVAINGYREAYRFQDEQRFLDAADDALSDLRQSQDLWFDAEFLKRERRFEEAIAKCRELLELEPHSANAHRELGTLLAATGYIPAGEDHLRIADREDPNDPGASAMLGWLALLQGKPVEALTHYDRAAAIEPWSDRIETMRGKCLLQLGRIDESIQALLKALTIDPTSGFGAAHVLRQVLRERLTAEEALPLAIQAAQLTKARQPVILLALAEIYRDTGRFAEAAQVSAVGSNISGRSAVDLRHQFRALDRSLADAPTQSESQ